jgi:hypothetical protein
MAADWEFLVVRRAGDRPVDIRKVPTVRLIPTPNFRRRIIERGGHFQNSRRLAVTHEPNGRPGRTVLAELPMSRLDQLYVEYMISTMGTLAINQLLSAIHRQSPARGEIS